MPEHFGDFEIIIEATYFKFISLILLAILILLFQFLIKQI
jgi:hypothetical protein